jgi:hypothetical protein
VFSTSHTAVAFGIKGVIAIGKSPLCFARPLGEATHVINDDRESFFEYRRRGDPAQPARFWRWMRLFPRAWCF